MRRIILPLISVCLILGVFLIIRVRTENSYAIWTQLQQEQPELAKKSALYFPRITDMQSLSYDDLPSEIRDIIPVGAKHRAIKKVIYPETEGVFVGGSLNITNIGFYLQSYGIQTRQARWSTTSGTYYGDAALWEIETPRYQARVIFLRNAFGIFVLEKHE